MPRDGARDGDETTAVRAPKEPVRAPPSGFILEVIDGADKGAKLVVDEASGRCLVGTSPACALQLQDREVSRRHFAVELQAGQLRLTDVGSLNGTHVEGLRSIDVLLKGGERITVGGTTLAARPFDQGASAPTSGGSAFGRVVGRSAAMRRLHPILRRLAASSVPIVIEGETGTGKELVGEALHEMGPRASAPFVVFDCTTVAPSLVEAALFGHVKGAFTGAIADRKGVFEQADGGTLLIDEIGDLDLPLQAKLLRAIERAEIHRVGGDRWIKVDVRVIAATRRDLDKAVQEGRFRDDLFYRLAVARIELPPLRARAGDAELLANAFWTSLGGQGPLPSSLARRLVEYDWPGNIRELYNEVSRHVALGDLVSMSSVAEAKPGASPHDAMDAIDEVIARRLPLVQARRQLVEAFERRYLEEVLARHGGNVGQAAVAAGVARRYFQFMRAKQRG